MDIIKILFPIVAALFYFYLTSRKKKNEESPPPIFEYDDEYEEQCRENPSGKAVSADFFEEKHTIPPKKGEFVSYDELGQEKWEEENSRMKIEERMAYSFDNEEENELVISTDIENIRQGIIYAEILKIPYKQ
ncbi:MAG: hypothetical protein LBV02_02575 [Bacteroidales bacterium]|jgi:hypothetical protein|nr:hypothetical protein [Bacteroidales bacterium]